MGQIKPLPVLSIKFYEKSVTPIHVHFFYSFIDTTIEWCWVVLTDTVWLAKAKDIYYLDFSEKVYWSINQMIYSIFLALELMKLKNY